MPKETVRPKHYGKALGIYELYKVLNAHGVNFNRGNAIKYLIRAGKKSRAKEVEDLLKAKQYIDFELERINL